jgi:O-antigen ligase
MRIKNFDALNVARYLLIGQLVAILFSPPLTNLLELSVYIVFATSSELRERVILVLKQPLAFMALVLFLFLGLGIVYSIENYTVASGYWISWRRLFMLPLALAVFGDTQWKAKTVTVFVAATSLLALVSYISLWLDFSIIKHPPGIVVRHPATQGMLFSVSAIAAFYMAAIHVRADQIKRLLFFTAALLLVLNVVLVGTGRSGYVVLIIMATLSGWWLLKNQYRLIAVVAIPVVIMGSLWLSPVAKERILMGWENATSYDKADEYTSMGVRMVMWRNTIKLVPDNPWFGVGTGGFETAYAELAKDEKGWRAVSVGDPHNQYLKILVEQGGLGLLIFLLFIWSFFRHNAEGMWRYLGLAVLLAWCTTSLFSSHFSTFAEGRFLVLWCGIMLAITLEGTRGRMKV